MVVSLFFSRTLGFRKSHFLKSPKLYVVYVWLPGKSNPAIGGGRGWTKNNCYYMGDVSKKVSSGEGIEYPVSG